jgi:hypothetical protein
MVLRVRSSYSAIEVRLTVAPVVIGVKELRVKRLHLHSDRVAFKNVLSVGEMGSRLTRRIPCNEHRGLAKNLGRQERQFRGS